MITAHQRLDGTVSLELDEADQVMLNKLARSYAITYKAMIVSCLYKGMDVISQQITAADKQPEGRDGSGDFR